MLILKKSLMIFLVVVSVISCCTISIMAASNYITSQTWTTPINLKEIGVKNREYSITKSFVVETGNKPTNVTIKQSKVYPGISQVNDTVLISVYNWNTTPHKLE